MALSLAHEVPLLAGCNADDARDGLSWFKRRHFEAGQTLITETERGRDFFLVLKGTVAVSCDGEFQRLLSGPTFVGEEAMLGLGCRSATVKAVTEVEAMVTGQIGFDELMRLPGVGREIAATVANRSRDRISALLSA